MQSCNVFVLIAYALVGAGAQDLFLSYKVKAVAESPVDRRDGRLLFRITHSGRFGDEFTGRVRLRIDTRRTSAPSELVFGKDVAAWRSGEVVTFAGGDDAVYGFPVLDLADLEKRVLANMTLYVQAELVVYDLYRRKDLPPTWLPTSCVSHAGLNGEYALPDGTLLSEVLELKLSDGPVDLPLDSIMPDSLPKSPGCAGLGDAVDSDWIKTVRVQSPLLSDFWGRNISLEACVLLPWGFDAHPDARYPLVVAHGHYSPVFMPGGGFAEKKPECDRLADYGCYAAHDAHELYKQWTDSEGVFHGARALIMTINHPVPFFDDSYAVNSASMGPYGDAILLELVPEVERRYRGLGRGWARGLLGGSTGGWEAVAHQIFYPDDFNGIHAACPDPVTFTSYVTANIYETRNYYFYDSPWLKRARPATRDSYSGQAFKAGVGPVFVDAYGQISQTLEEANHQELAQGTHSRSCGQWDIWEATFSPTCADGFPCRLYDKLTGELNLSIAEYWREHYDFAHILKRDWATLGPKLAGKLNIFVGGSDTFYLDNAVMDLRNVLLELGSDANVTIGAHEGIGYQHCFNGYLYGKDGKALPNAISRNYYLQMTLPGFARHWAASAPAGEDVVSWRY